MRKIVVSLAFAFILGGCAAPNPPADIPADPPVDGTTSATWIQY